MNKDVTKNITFFRFEDLRVYHKALDYVDWVYNATKLFPEDNSKILAERFINSAQAIAFYIAEGSARNKTHFVHYLKMAKSSVRECVVVTSLIEKQSLFSEVMIDASRNELMELTKMIGALIGSLQRAERNKNKFSAEGSEEDYNYNTEAAVELIPAESIDIKKY